MNAVVDKADPGSDVPTLDKALAAAEAAQRKKGYAVTLINVDGVCSYTDAILIVSVSSERQARAIGGAVEDAVRERYDLRPLHREGEGSWVLLDYGDLVVHLFLEETRAYYDIDKLWSDAPRVPVPALSNPVELTSA